MTHFDQCKMRRRRPSSPELNLFIVLQHVWSECRNLRCRAISSCALWIFKVRDVYRMASMQPNLVWNIRRTFVDRMTHALHALPADVRHVLVSRSQFRFRSLLRSCKLCFW